MKKLFLAILVFLVSCSSQSSTPKLGQTEAKITLPSGSNIQQVNWQLDCLPYAAVPSSGTWDVGDDTGQASGLIGNIDMRDTCTFTITAQDSYGQDNGIWNCNASVSNVTPIAEDPHADAGNTIGNMNLVCEDGAVVTPSVDGYVSASVSITSTNTGSHQCQSLSSFTVTPIVVSVGNSTQISIAVTDAGTKTNIAMAANDDGTYSNGSIGTPYNDATGWHTNSQEMGYYFDAPFTVSYTCNSAGYKTLVSSVMDMTPLLAPPGCPSIDRAVVIHCE